MLDIQPTHIVLVTQQCPIITGTCTIYLQCFLKSGCIHGFLTKITQPIIQFSFQNY